MNLYFVLFIFACLFVYSCLIKFLLFSGKTSGSVARVDKQRSSSWKVGKPNVQLPSSFCFYSFKCITGNLVDLFISWFFLQLELWVV